jgi:FkbM family methyltransferase
MKISEIKSEYKNKKINKTEFIDIMHNFHEVLFDFSQNLSKTEIKKIEINDTGVIFTTRETKLQPGGVSFYVDIFDKRVCPIETFNFGQYELEDSEMLYNLVGNSKVLFDIGANIGWYSIHLSKMMPSVRIYSFEPIPETFKQAKLNIKLNDLKNIELCNIALAAKKEKLHFYYSPTVTGASSSQNITENVNMIKIECEADTLDNFVMDNNIEKIDFIKCDVEGAEYFVFQGALETLKKYKPIVFTEMLRKWAFKFNYHPNDIINLFKSVGYKCYYSCNGKLKVIDFILEDTIPTNFFFLQPEIHSDLILKNS